MRVLAPISILFSLLLLAACGTEVGNGNRETKPIEQQDAKRSPDAAKADEVAEDNMSAGEASSGLVISEVFIAMAFVECAEITTGIEQDIALNAWTAETAVSGGEFNAKQVDQSTFEIEANGADYRAETNDGEVSLTNLAKRAKPQEYEFDCLGDREDLESGDLAEGAESGSSRQIQYNEKTYNLEWQSKEIDSSHEIIQIRFFQVGNDEPLLILKAD